MSAPPVPTPILCPAPIGQYRTYRAMSQLVSFGACRRWSRTFFSSLSRRRLFDLGMMLSLPSLSVLLLLRFADGLSAGCEVTCPSPARLQCN